MSKKKCVKKQKPLTEKQKVKLALERIRTSHGGLCCAHMDLQDAFMLNPDWIGKDERLRIVHQLLDQAEKLLVIAEADYGIGWE